MDKALVVLDDLELPIVPDERNAAQWAEIAASPVPNDRIKRALLRVAAGAPFREAASAEGYKDHKRVFFYAKKFGLIDVKTNSLIALNRDIARLSGEILRDRLIDEPGEFTNRDLAVDQGISMDKVLAYEAKAKSDGADYISALERISRDVIATGQGLEITVAVRPTEVREIVDVTPSAISD